MTATKRSVNGASLSVLLLEATKWLVRSHPLFRQSTKRSQLPPEKVVEIDPSMHYRSRSQMVTGAGSKKRLFFVTHCVPQCISGSSEVAIAYSTPVPELAHNGLCNTHRE